MRKEVITGMKTALPFNPPVGKSKPGLFTEKRNILNTQFALINMDHYLRSVYQLVRDFKMQNGK